MIENSKVKRTETKKETMRKQDKASSVKPSNNNVVTGRKKATIESPELLCFNRFLFLEEEEITKDLDNLDEKFEKYKCCRKLVLTVLFKGLNLVYI